MLLILHIVLKLIIIIKTKKNNIEIFEGKIARENEYPHLVSLKYTPNEGSFCGGSLISSDCVLTAAHCLEYFMTNDLTIYVQAGTNYVHKGDEENINDNVNNNNNGVLRRVIGSVVHVNYLKKYKNKEDKFKFDIAMLFLEEGIFENGKDIRYAKVLNMNKNKLKNIINYGSSIDIAGWGDYNIFQNAKEYRKDLRLRKAVIPIIECQTEVYGEYFYCIGLNTKNSSINAGIGDSGSAMVKVFDINDKRWTIIGICSHGYRFSRTGKVENQFTAYVKVSNFYPWILNIVGDLPETSEYLTPLNYIHERFNDYSCYGIPNKSSMICNGKGICVSMDKCKCENSFGYECKVWGCSGIAKNNLTVCSSRGDCIYTDKCICNSKRLGKFCESIDFKNTIYIFAFSIVMIIFCCINIFMILVVLLINFKKLIKKNSHIITKNDIRFMIIDSIKKRNKVGRNVDDLTEYYSS